MGSKKFILFYFFNFIRTRIQCNFCPTKPNPRLFEKPPFESCRANCNPTTNERGSSDDVFIPLLNANTSEKCNADDDDDAAQDAASTHANPETIKANDAGPGPAPPGPVLLFPGQAKQARQKRQRKTLLFFTLPPSLLLSLPPPVVFLLRVNVCLPGPFFSLVHICSVPSFTDQQTLFIYLFYFYFVESCCCFTIDCTPPPPPSLSVCFPATPQHQSKNLPFTLQR